MLTEGKWVYVDITHNDNAMNRMIEIVRSIYYIYRSKRTPIIKKANLVFSGHDIVFMWRMLN